MKFDEWQDIFEDKLYLPEGVPIDVTATWTDNGTFLTAAITVPGVRLLSEKFAVMKGSSLSEEKMREVGQMLKTYIANCICEKKEITKKDLKKAAERKVQALIDMGDEVELGDPR